MLGVEVWQEPGSHGLVTTSLDTRLHENLKQMKQASNQLPPTSHFLSRMEVGGKDI